MKQGGCVAFGAILALVASASHCMAQEAAMVGSGGQAPAARILKDSASPFGQPAAAELDPAGVEMPKLDFTTTPADAEDFDKYYYFHRDGTDFPTAYTDLRECDGYASGLSSGVGYVATPYPYAGTMAGALGGAIGNVLAVAIFGSAEKRKARRVNMRLCMFYKGYQRFGLSKQLWTEFNFEEGIGHVGQERRIMFLKRQALVASGATPKGEALGL